MTATLRGISIEGREAVKTTEGTEYTYIARVNTNDKNDGPNIVLSAAGIPALGDLYNPGNDFDPAAIITNLEPRQLQSPTEWEVKITANTNVTTDPAEQVDNPLLQPARIEYSFTSQRQLLWGFYDDSVSPDTNKDFTSAPLMSNGEEAVPQPMAEFDIPVITIERNLASLPFAFNDLAGSVNLTTFLGADPRQLRARTRARSTFHKEVGNYWVLIMTFLYKFETWDVQILNRGTWYLDADGTTKVREFVDGVPKRVLLGSTGGLLAAGATPTFNRLRVYREIDFNALGLI